MSKIRKKVWGISREIPVLNKGKQGYKFKYTDLDVIHEAINPLLEKAKIGYQHTTVVIGEQNVLRTVVFDLESDDEIVSELIIPWSVKLAGMNDYQSLGSALTYFRRYHLLVMLDIITEEDVDSSKPTKSKTKVDWILNIKNLIAQGKYTKQQMESYFNKNRGLMDDEQKRECIALIKNIK